MRVSIASNGVRESSPVRRGLGFVLALVMVIPWTACGDDRPSFYEDTPLVTGPFAAEGRFLYLDRRLDEIVAVTPDFGRDGLSHTIERVAVGGAPTRLWLAESGRLAFTINAEDQTISIVDVVTLDEVRLDLPSDYDALTIDPRGRFVVAHFSDPESGGSGDSVFVNQNEITIFDLHPDTDGALGEVTMEVLSLRSSPLGFEFAPVFSVDNTEHHMLVVRAESALALIDMTAEADIDRQRRLFFVPEDSTERVIPRRVLFGFDDENDDFDTRMFVLASNSQDIYEVSLLPPGPDDETQLAISLNQFPAGPSPTDMLSFAAADGSERLLVTNGNRRELAVVDVDTGASLSIDIGWNVRSILPFTLVDEEDESVENWALLYTQGEEVIVFANLDSIEDRGARALSSLALSRPVARFERLDGSAGDKIVAIHVGETAISVVDLARRFDVPLPGTATLSNTAFSSDGGHMFTTVAEVAVMAIIELENGHPSQIDIPEPGGSLAVLRDPQVILIDHGADEGRITLVSGVDPQGEPMRTVDGLFWDDLFGRAEAIAARGE